MRTFQGTRDSVCRWPHSLVIALVVGGLTGPFWSHTGGFPSPVRADAQRELRTPPELISQLVEQLGSPQFVVRQRAEKRLLRLGLAAFDALINAENDSDPEVAARARYLIGAVPIPWTTERDSKEIRTLLHNYGSLRPDERLARIGQIATRRTPDGLEALCRVIRYEPSRVLSKEAALAVIQISRGRSNLVVAHEDRIRQTLGGSDRDSANWIRAYRLTEHQPATAWAEWGRLAEEEYQRSLVNPEQSKPQIPAFMFYLLVDAHDRQGHDERAQTVAERASAIRIEDVRQRWLFALRLQRNGLFRGAIDAYRAVMEGQPGDSQFAIVARLYLAEMLHDYNRNLEAADALEPVIQAMADGEWARRLVTKIRGRTGAVRSRAEFFRACHWEQQQQASRQKEHLERAIQHDPLDADVIIAMHRYPEADEAYRIRTRERIRTAATAFRQQIEQEPEAAAGYNQLAWLICNTEGDFDEALRLSKKSLELLPGSAGYLDTLAHAYFAKGDYAHASQAQHQAAEIEPHTQVILRKLEEFEQALAQFGSGVPADPGPEDTQP